MAIESKCEGGHDQGRGAVAWVPISRYTVSGSRISRGERGTPLTTSKTTPFTIAVPQAVLDDLRERLARTRFPDQPPGAPWAYGTDLGYLRELVSYWQTRYDWRKHEAELNGFRQFTAPVAGIGVHFLHEEGRGPSPLPLILSHGWPGSVWEFHKIIPMLTDPARFGGDARDAFTVVAPSLPGYGFSFAPGQARFGITEIADAWAQLMTDVLGYRRFAAQGGDWGGFITSRLGAAYPERLAGIHVNLLSLRRDLPRPDKPTPEERAYLDDLGKWLREETGYQWIQGTKPQTLAYGLTDSPAGLAAWIVEKFRTWSDCGGDVERSFSKDELLTNVMLYWVTGAIGSSFWPYYARYHAPWPIADGQRIEVPTAYADFPKEIIRPPRSWAERIYNIKRWTVMPSGGHFAALEEPRLLAEDIRAFFRDLR
ncbi:MAG: multidrug MFS transporter [Candidatus Rokuibacteriota bacterium]|nr:MAG: multidrug MFS transporter [Candidatus Rokubacteria bacterium]